MFFGRCSNGSSAPTEQPVGNWMDIFGCWDGDAAGESVVGPGLFKGTAVAGLWRMN